MSDSEGRLFSIDRYAAFNLLSDSIATGCWPLLEEESKTSISYLGWRGIKDKSGLSTALRYILFILRGLTTED